MSHAATAAGLTDDGPSGMSIKVIAFKLLDLVKMHDEFTAKGGASHQSLHQHQKQHQKQQQQQNIHSGYTAPTPSRPPARHPQQQQQQAPRVASAPAAAPMNRQQPPQQQQRPLSNSAPRPVPSPKQRQEASLMDFGDSSNGGGGTTPQIPVPSVNNKAPVPNNETRAERLKREYAQKNNQASRVWDDIDQRWVEVDKDTIAKATSASSSLSMGGLRASISSIGGGGVGDASAVPKKKEIGIKLDASNAIGKSANVQAAVHGRVNDMRQAQAKALHEVREREMKKKQDEAEEDNIRKVLEPKIKLWSEEHGKTKQLRALLASLHTILWPNSGWKQVTIGDLLDGKKIKIQFHKASRVVHPDKTHHLPIDQRFLAKRIFDALSQAKNEFDESGGK